MDGLRNRVLGLSRSLWNHVTAGPCLRVPLRMPPLEVYPTAALFLRLVLTAKRLAPSWHTLVPLSCRLLPHQAFGTVLVTQHLPGPHHLCPTHSGWYPTYSGWYRLVVGRISRTSFWRWCLQVWQIGHHSSVYSSTRHYDFSGQTPVHL